MGQSANPKRTAANEAFAFAKYMRISPRKLNLIAASIRGKKAERALTDLDFLQKAAAIDVKKVLASAVANAENNHGLDVDRLYVKEATVGKTLTMKRFSARGRGRASRIEKPFANLTIIVAEQTEEAPAKKAKAPKKSVETKAADGAKKPAAKKTAAKKTTKKDEA